MEVYTTDEARTTSRPERRPASRRTVIEAAKAAVPTIDLADWLCGPGRMRRAGERWVARCPLPDHEERTPSFTVYVDNNSWFCYGCLRGGDVIELARFAWGYDKAQVGMAAANLLHEFGHPIPERPPSYFAKGERQRDVRAAVEQTRKNVYRRRLFKYLILPVLEPIEDEEEYRREIARAWADFQEMLT